MAEIKEDVETRIRNKMKATAYLPEGHAAMFARLSRDSRDALHFVTYGDIRCDHILRLGSLTKTLLAFIALKQGLPLDDAVEKHISQLDASTYPGSDLITFRHLMTHTSGVFNFTELPNATQLAHTFTPALLVDLAWKSRNLSFSPGTARYYSNTNSEIVALWLEQHTGTSTRDLFEQEFRKHDLKSLTLDVGEKLNFPLTTPGYRDFTMPHSFPSASGRLLATAEDAMRAMRAMADEKEIWQLMKQWTDAPLYPDPDNPAGGRKYGLFLQEFQFKNNTIGYGHDGHIGVSTIVFETPEYIYLIHSTTDMHSDKWMEYVNSIMDEVLP